MYALFALMSKKLICFYYPYDPIFVPTLNFGVRRRFKSKNKTFGTRKVCFTL